MLDLLEDLFVLFDSFDNKICKIDNETCIEVQKKTSDLFFVYAHKPKERKILIKEFETLKDAEMLKKNIKKTKKQEFNFMKII